MITKKDAKDFVKIIQKDQFNKAVEKLSGNIQSLNMQLISLNGVLESQNKAVKDSIGETTDAVKTLRKEFKKLNEEMKKSTSFFSRMDRSNEIIGKLTIAVLIFTAVGTFNSLYTVMRDAAPGIETQCIIAASFITTCILVILVYVFILKEKK